MVMTMVLAMCDIERWQLSSFAAQDVNKKDSVSDTPLCYAGTFDEWC
jgi:hypothetical protein